MIKRYGFLGYLSLVLSKILTIIFYSPARLIRFPFDIRNRRYISFGENFTTGKYCRLEAHPPNNDRKEACIVIGNNVQLNDSVHIVGSEGVWIGDDVLLASKIFITDLNHGSYGSGDIHDSPLGPPNDRPLSSKKVVIEKNVWIGEFVSVLPGVTIGEGSIIGTMSVVSKSIPPFCIAVGSPAMPIKKFNFETQRWEKII